MFRITAVLALLIGTAAMTVPAADPPKGEDRVLAVFFQSHLDHEFVRHPVYATHLGHHDHDDLMDDLSPEARRKDAEYTNGILELLPKDVNRNRLSRDGQIDFDILRHH